MEFAEIEVDEVETWLARGAQLVDVREEWEYVSGHVPGAVHIPMGEVADRVGELRAPLVLVCRSGARSGRVAEYLANSGFGEVANMLGGTIAWMESGRDVVEGTDPLA